MICQWSISGSVCGFLEEFQLDSKRIYRIIERRYKSNNNKTSFDFKSIDPEKPSNNAKVTRSFLRFNPKMNAINAYENLISSASSQMSASDEDGDDDGDDETNNGNQAPANNEDNYLEELASWRPDSFQPILQEESSNSADHELLNTRLSTCNQTNHSKALGKHKALMFLFILFDKKILVTSNACKVSPSKLDF